MTDATHTTERPPYRAALVVTLVVLAGYIASLAPTVTFWDAGEFIAATKILGIPHPPGTPLFVLMGHVWATLLPIGSWAYPDEPPQRHIQRGWVRDVVPRGARVLASGNGGEGGKDWTRLFGAAAAAVIGAFAPIG
jgi:hypothetical protein